MPNPAFFQILERQHTGAHEGRCILDPDVVGTLLELGGDEPSDLIVELVDLYLEDAEMRLEDLHAARGRGDVAGVGSTVHALKSASANIGAVCLSQLCRDIESSSRSGARPADLDGPLQQLDALLLEVREALAALRDSCR